MKNTLIASVAVLALAAGCSNKNKTAGLADGTLTDVAPPPPVVSNNTGVPMGTGPIVPTTPIETTPVDVSGAGAMGPGQKYVVQKGDTLWSIAKRTYGDGKQYTKIKAANPNIKGDTILAGQTIILP